MTDAGEGNLQAPLAEFAALRAEILQTLSTQWNIFALQITAAGVIFSFSLSRNSRVGFLLILPVISYILGSRCLDNLAGIWRLGDYIMEELSPRVPGGLRWEEWGRQRPRSYGVGIFRWLAPPTLLVAFPGVSMTALVWVVPYILFGHLSALSRSLTGVIWILDLIMTFSFFCMTIQMRNAQLRRLQAPQTHYDR